MLCTSQRHFVEFQERKHILENIRFCLNVHRASHNLEISMKVILQMDLFTRYMRIFNIRYLNLRKFGSHLRKYRKKISILYFSANGRSSRITSSSPRRCARSACAPTRRTPMTWTCPRRRWRRLTPAAASAGCRLCQLLLRQISAIFSQD